MSGENAPSKESAGQLPKQYREALGLEGNPTPAEALASAEAQLKEVLEQQHKYPERSPAQVKLKREREHLEPLVRELREMVFGLKVDELCDNAEAALAEQPPKTAKIRDLLKRARVEGKALDPASDYLRRVQKLEALLDGGDSATPRPTPSPAPAPPSPTPPPQPAPVASLEAKADPPITPQPEPALAEIPPDEVQPTMANVAVENPVPSFEEAPPTLPYAPGVPDPPPQPPSPNPIPPAPPPEKIHADVLPAKSSKRLLVFALVFGLLLIAVAYAGYLAFSHAPKAPAGITSLPIPPAPQPTNNPAPAPPPPATPAETAPAPDAGPVAPQGPATPEVVQPEIGQFIIYVTPANAQLFTNGVPLVPIHSPTQLTGLSQAEIVIEARLDGYSNALQKVVFPAPGADAKLTFDLQPKPALLFIHSEPSAAEILVRKNGGPAVNTANAPEGIELAPGAPAQITLTVPEYNTVSRDIPSLKPGQSLMVDFGRLTAKPVAVIPAPAPSPTPAPAPVVAPSPPSAPPVTAKPTLTVTGPNDGADVYVDNVFTGVKNGGTLSGLTIGRSYNIRLHKAGHLDISHIVTIRAGNTAQNEYFAALPLAAGAANNSAAADQALRTINDSIVKVRGSLPLTDSSRQFWNTWIDTVQKRYQSDPDAWARVQGPLTQLRTLVNTTAPTR